MKISRTTSKNSYYQELVALLDQELRLRIGSLQKSYESYNKFSELVDVVLISQEDKPVACGVIRGLEGYNWAEMKRVFVHPDYRGQGFSKIIILHLEQWATEQDFDALVLETGDILFEALALYQKMGYQIIENFAPYTDMPKSICMKKDLNEVV